MAAKAVRKKITPRVKAGKGRSGKRLEFELKLIPRSKERSTYRKAFDLAQKDGQTDAVAGLLWQSHESGDPRATYALATWYIHGPLFDTNPKAATKLLNQAAKQGVAEALYDLAHSFEVGFGVEKSFSKAADLYIQAALKGDKSAIKEVIRCVYYGIGVSKNRKLAFLIEDLST